MKKFARKQTLERLKTLKAQIRKAADDPKDAESIHDLRVSIRRFVQCLKVFQQFFDLRASHKIRRRLEKLMDRCAAVRNCDVAIELLREIEGTHLMEGMVAMRETAERTLADSLQRWRHRSIRKTWPNRLQAPARAGLWHAGTPASEDVRRVLPKLAERFFRAGNTAASRRATQPAMHRFRIHAKQFRYTLELFEPLYGEGLTNHVAQLRTLQDKLGRLNDCVASQELVKDDARAVAALARRATTCETEFRAQWARHFDAVSRKRWKASLAGTAVSEIKKKEPNADLHSPARRSRVA